MRRKKSWSQSADWQNEYRPSFALWQDRRGTFFARELPAGGKRLLFTLPGTSGREEKASVKRVEHAKCPRALPEDQQRENGRMPTLAGKGAEGTCQACRDSPLPPAHRKIQSLSGRGEDAGSPCRSSASASFAFQPGTSAASLGSMQVSMKSGT